MADTQESFEVYIDSDRADEFRTLMQEKFGDAAELNWRDTIEI